MQRVSSLSKSCKPSFLFQTYYLNGGTRVLNNKRTMTNCNMVQNDDHPTIDVSCLLNNPDDINTTSAEIGKERKIVEKKILSALQTKGYFYAKGVSVLPQEYIKDVYKYADDLHKLPLHAKEYFKSDNGSGGGYSGTDIGLAELDYDPGSKANVRSWDYIKGSKNENQSKLTDNNIANGKTGNNNMDGISISDIISSYPMNTYKKFMDDLYKRQDVLARALMSVFACMFGLNSQQQKEFVDMFGDGKHEYDLGTIRLLHYPGFTDSAEKLNEKNFGISAHTDFEVFTLMHQNASGLQFLSHETNEWFDAPVRDGEFVVIVGDVLERFTNGWLKATPHRVIQVPHERSSIIRFVAIKPDVMIEPYEQFVTPERPLTYTPVTMQQHMDTTMNNLKAGKGAWDPVKQQSLTATYNYI